MQYEAGDIHYNPVKAGLVHTAKEYVFVGAIGSSSLFIFRCRSRVGIWPFFLALTKIGSSHWRIKFYPPPSQF